MAQRLKPAHYRGTYQADRAALMRTVRPTSRCRRCGLTLPECQPHKDGRPAFWTAGHVDDSAIGGALALECSPCNFEAGGRLRHTRAKTRNGNPTSRRWFE